jgi:hypothetical protein
VPVALVFVGMACGMLLAAVGLMVWGRSRQVPKLSRAIRAIRWLAGTFLLAGALFAWLGDRNLAIHTSRFILMAVLATLPEIRHRRLPCSHPGGVMLILPALVLVGVSLFLKAEASGIEISGFPATIVRLVVIVCGGFGARALSQYLGAIAVQSPHSEEALLSATIAYALLTLIAGGTALVNLWQRGSVWTGIAEESRLASAWLAWSAAWPCPRRPVWWRALLMTVATLLLIILVMGW